jgi:hypothetical protein
LCSRFRNSPYCAITSRGVGARVEARGLNGFNRHLEILAAAQQLACAGTTRSGSSATIAFGGRGDTVSVACRRWTVICRRSVDGRRDLGAGGTPAINVRAATTAPPGVHGACHVAHRPVPVMGGTPASAGRREVSLGHRRQCGHRLFRRRAACWHRRNAGARQPEGGSPGRGRLQRRGPARRTAPAGDQRRPRVDVRHQPSGALCVDRLAHAPAVGRAGRIVTTGSFVGKSARLDLDGLQSARDYRPKRTYARSKLAQMLFGFELDRRLRAVGSTAPPSSQATRWPGSRSSRPRR